MPITIFHTETNAKETWLEVNENETVTYHIENSGWPMMRKGINARETHFTIDEAKARWSSYAKAIDDAVAKIHEG